MPENVDNAQIQSILQTLGERIATPSRLILIGGGALALLGSPRPTIDIDFIGDDVSPSESDQAILRAAKELNIFAELVPLERFIPLPAGSGERAIKIGKFGNLEVYVADPYSIAFSKLERGFDTDLEDIVFLVQRGFIELVELERMTDQSLLRAREFDLNVTDMLAHLQTVRERLK